MKILFLVPYPTGSAASQRFRFEQYYNILSEQGFQVTTSSFLEEKTWHLLYKKGHIIYKIGAIVKGFIRRLLIIPGIGKYNFVFIHREAAPIGPPVIEWLIARVFRKRIIYDFDDAIWIPNTSHTNRLMQYLKRFSNTRTICCWAYKVSCGNPYLRNYALQYNKEAFLVPTVVDTVHYHNKEKQHDAGDFVIGWTGTHSTIRYLQEIVPVIAELEKEIHFTFMVISDTKPDFSLSSLKYIQWRKETEIEDLLNFHIGLMPLTDDKWAQGKCGFKAIQYMALGIPALVSPVGVNVNIVDNGVSGYVCTTSEDWKNSIKQLYEHRVILKDMAAQCRAKIVAEYSIAANTKSFLKLFS